MYKRDKWRNRQGEGLGYDVHYSLLNFMCMDIGRRVKIVNKSFKMPQT